MRPSAPIDTSPVCRVLPVRLTWVCLPADLIDGFFFFVFCYVSELDAAAPTNRGQLALVFPLRQARFRGEFSPRHCCVCSSGGALVSCRIFCHLSQLLPPVHILLFGTTTVAVVYLPALQSPRFTILAVGTYVVPPASRPAGWALRPRQVTGCGPLAWLGHILFRALSTFFSSLGAPRPCPLKERAATVPGLPAPPPICHISPSDTARGWVSCLPVTTLYEKE